MTATRRGWGPGQPGPGRFPLCTRDYTKAEKRNQVADYKGVLVDLKSRRAAIDEEAKGLDRAILALENLVTVDERPVQTAQAIDHTQESPRVSRRAFSSLTMPQAIEKCLKLTGHSVMKRQIQDTLRAGGVRASKSFSAHVYNTLKRLSKNGGQFRREPDGTWGLSAWPQRVTPRQSGVASANTKSEE